MGQKHWKKIVEIQPDGIHRIRGGAYCFYFIYSNKGNFLVKGFRHECELYLKNLIGQGYRFFYHQVAFNRKIKDILDIAKAVPMDELTKYLKSFQDQDIVEKPTLKDLTDHFQSTILKNRHKFARDAKAWNVWTGLLKDGPYIFFSPPNKNSKRWRIYYYDTNSDTVDITFKRLPKRWIPELDTFINQCLKTKQYV